nr:MarR family transcriptional regulator [Rubellimicrobium arenae]
MAVGRLYKPLLDELGITYPQYLALSALWEEDGRGIGAIADRLALEPSTVTPLVKRLEAAGLVRRERNPADERQVFVSLTETGRAMQGRSRCLGEALMAASAMTPDRLMRLGAEVRALRDALARQIADRGEPVSERPNDPEGSDRA